jgi:hypothetical protein
MPVKRNNTRRSDESSSASQRAVSRVRSEGLRLPDKPDEGVPRLPRDLSEVSDVVLMRLLSEYTQWLSYLGTIVAQAEIDEQEAENQAESLGDMIMVKNWGGTSSDRVSLAKAHRGIDPEYLQRRSAFAEAKAYRKMIGRLYDNVDGEKFTVSRELTRRIGREPVERRDRRWNT